MTIETVSARYGAIFSLELEVRGCEYEPYYISVDDVDDIEYETTWALADLYTSGYYDVHVIDSIHDKVTPRLLMFIDGQKAINVGPAIAEIADWRIARSTKPNRYHKPPERVSAELLTVMMRVHNLEVSGQKGTPQHQAAVALLDKVELEHGVDRSETW